MSNKFKNTVFFLMIFLLIVSLSGCFFSKDKKRMKELDEYLALNEKNIGYVTYYNYDGGPSDSNVIKPSLEKGRHLFITSSRYFYYMEDNYYIHIFSKSLYDESDVIKHKSIKIGEYNDFLMINPDKYYQYEVVEHYFSAFEQAFGKVDKYIYTWYEFNVNNENDYQVVKRYESKNEMTSSEIKKMRQDFHFEMIKSMFNGPFTGDIIYVNEIEEKGEKDEFYLERVVGYNPELECAIFYYIYNRKDVKEKALHLFFLVDYEGNSTYIGEYNDYRDSANRNDYYSTVPMTK